MAEFSQRIVSDDVIATNPDALWQVLCDPDRVAELTPLVAVVTEEGDRWRWRLTGIKALGIQAAPVFTTVMDIGRLHMRFTPAPDTAERASAAGTLLVRPEEEDRAFIAIDLTATVDVPLPSQLDSPVRRVMFRAMRAGGERFAHNLLDSLGNPWHRGLDVRDGRDEAPLRPS